MSGFFSLPVLTRTNHSFFALSYPSQGHRGPQERRVHASALGEIGFATPLPNPPPVTSIARPA